MSHFTEQDIVKIANLSKIEISQDDKTHLTTQINKIINWVEKLNEVKTDEVEVFTSPYDMKLRLEKDEISDGDIAEDVLKNSKGALYNYFSVPKVIE